MSTNKGAAHAFYCGSAVDDFGLTSTQFRVLFHLKRRAGNGVAKCGIRSIARICDLHIETVVRAIRDLENQNIINCERRLKRTTRYFIQPSEQWVKLLSKTEQSDGLNCYLKPNRVLSKTEQIVLSKTEQNCSETDNVRLSGIPKDIPKKAKTERTRNEHSPISRKVDHQKKPFAVAGEESIRELQKRRPYGRAVL